MFPDFAQVCAHDGFALETVLGATSLAGLFAPPRLTWALGALALAASLWAGAEVTARSIRQNLRFDVASAELRKGESLFVKVQVANTTSFAVDVAQARLELAIPGSPVRVGVGWPEDGRSKTLAPGAKEEFTLTIPMSDPQALKLLLGGSGDGVEVHSTAEMTVRLLGFAWTMTPSQHMLLKPRIKDVTVSAHRT